MHIRTWIVTLVPYPLIWWGAAQVQPALGPLATGICWWLDLQVDAFTARRAKP